MFTKIDGSIVTHVCINGITEGEETLESSELRKAGLKVTLPRVKILDIMEGGSSRHQSAEDVYKALLDMGEDIGLATVYRVLTQFEAAGLVTRHHFEGGHSVFELNEGSHHDHILCVKCGKVDEFVDEVIEQRQKDIARKLGYEMTDHCLYMYGICSKCRAE
ncbi:MAG: ferric iron uptake transcriptional regulator [Gammaproteobacteria bacterium]|nr:ferric iron uptake transcriptional regulator [Gammaproteobacteria bacterium]